MTRPRPVTYSPKTAAQDVPATDVPATDVPATDVPATDGAVEGVNPVDQASTQAGPQDTARGQGGADNNDTETEAPLAVYGDAAYGAGALLAKLEAAGADIMTKVQPPVAPGGRFPKDAFTIDPGAGTVTCQAHLTVPIKAAKARGGTAAFGIAPAARWRRSARPPRLGARSASAPTKPS